MQPFIPYPGGKSKLAPILVREFLPPSRIYVEPFAGGASVFFHRSPSEVEVLNDLDASVISMYEDVRSVPCDVILAFDMRMDRDRFTRLLRTDLFASKDERLYRNLYLSKVSFSGNRRDPATNSFAQRHRSETDSVFTRERCLDIQRRLRGVRVENRDFREVLRDYDAEDAVFYLDPPYRRAIPKNYYAFNRLPPREVEEATRDLRGRVVVSYDDTEEVRDAFSPPRWDVHTLDANYSYSRHHRTKKVEL